MTVPAVERLAYGYRPDGTRGWRAWRALTGAAERGDEAAIEVGWLGWLRDPAEELWEFVSRWRTPADVLATAVDPGLSAESRAAIEMFCLRRDLVPDNDVDRALFFVLTGHHEPYGALDPDSALLAAAYRGASDATREALRHNMIILGELNAARVIADHPDRTLTSAEADYLAQRLADAGEWERLWRLVPAMPLPDAMRAARLFPDWRPADGWPFLARLAGTDPGTVDTVSAAAVTWLGDWCFGWLSILVCRWCCQGDRVGRMVLHRECFDLVPDELFADLFTDVGRRSVPPVIVAVPMALQRIEGLSDRDAVDRFAFDARWKYAAGGLDFDYPGFVHTVLVDMRARLARSDRPDRIFQVTVDVARQAGVVGRRRVLDSTPLYDALIDSRSRDAMAMLTLLEGRELDERIGPAAQLLASVVGQDIVKDEGVFRIARAVAPARVISTVDTEARHGHKSQARGFDGYKGHIANDPDSEIITATGGHAGQQRRCRGRREPPHRHPALRSRRPGCGLWGFRLRRWRTADATGHRRCPQRNQSSAACGGEGPLSQGPLQHRPRGSDRDLPRWNHRAHPRPRTPCRTSPLRGCLRHLRVGQPVHHRHRRTHHHHQRPRNVPGRRSYPTGRRDLESRLPGYPPEGGTQDRAPDAPTPRRSPSPCPRTGESRRRLLATGRRSEPGPARRPRDRPPRRRLGDIRGMGEPDSSAHPATAQQPQVPAGRQSATQDQTDHQPATSPEQIKRYKHPFDTSHLGPLPERIGRPGEALAAEVRTR
ncbi:MAG TPA: transposase [Actinophytocola sp.]